MYWGGATVTSKCTRAPMESMWCSTACNLGGRDVCFFPQQGPIAFLPSWKRWNYPKSRVNYSKFILEGNTFSTSIVFYHCGRSSLNPWSFFFFFGGGGGDFGSTWEFLSWKAWSFADAWQCSLERMGDLWWIVQGSWHISITMHNWICLKFQNHLWPETIPIRLLPPKWHRFCSRSHDNFIGRSLGLLAKGRNGKIMDVGKSFWRWQLAYVGG